MIDEREDNPPTTKCPGCGVEVAWLSNCGRYACIEVFGVPIVLDPVHRRSLAKRKAKEAKE